MSYSNKKRSFEDYQNSHDSQDNTEQKSKIKKLFDRNDSITQEILKELSKESENSDNISYMSITSVDDNNEKDDKDNLTDETSVIEKTTDILDDSISDFDGNENFSSLDDSETQDLSSLSLSSVIIDTTSEDKKSFIENNKDDDYYDSDTSSIKSITYDIDNSDLFSVKSEEENTYTYLKKQVEDTRLDDKMKSLINNSKKYLQDFEKDNNNYTKNDKQTNFITEYIENISYNSDDDPDLNIDIGLSEKYVIDSDEEELGDKDKEIMNGEMDVDTDKQDNNKQELDTEDIVKQIRDLSI